MLSSDEVKRAAAEVGFDACGTARATMLDDDEFPLNEWLARGWNGSLAYMARNVEKRLDPRQLVVGAKSVICVVSAYGPPDPDRHDGVAAYAQRREYHDVMKSMLMQLRQRLGIDGKACCDTVPISDKRWAARAGLGWIGRHTLLVTRRWGSWVNIGEIVTTEECDRYDSDSVTVDESHAKGCEACGRCVRACPNGAIAASGRPMLDARRCTAYYTTHNPQPLPVGLDARGYVQGCDICQLACPYNAAVEHVANVQV